MVLIIKIDEDSTTFKEMGDRIREVSTHKFVDTIRERLENETGYNLYSLDIEIMRLP